MTVCKRCVMDDSNDPDIRFDEDGFCNYCRDYIKNLPSSNYYEFLRVISNIKKAGKNKKYDCLLGVSGGVDSSYVAYLAKKYGLRTLLFSFDNGWNTEVAKNNIKNIVDSTGFDIFEYIVDFDEFMDLQLSMLKASVINVEMVTDHAITACLYKVAKDGNIKYILSGINYETEAIMPQSWGHRWNDLPNILDIHRKFGKIPLKTYPTLSLWKRVYYHLFKQVKLVPLLNYMDYNKEKAKQIIKKAFGWEDYGFKHYESLWTKFYQAYILHIKFHVDKRRAHLSCLICSGQLTRTEALCQLEKPIYPLDELKRDKAIILSKLGLSEQQFEKYMQQPIKQHKDYDSDELLYRVLKCLRR